MNEERRPSPEALLRKIEQKEKEDESGRGKLKIILGAAAGVGKTYKMLEEARLLKEQGQDVVVALVETHGRLETEALLEGLEIIPRRKVEYGGIVLGEMDLDAVLARHPALALVDELAHTNALGSLHDKRIQDVETLLDAGISVYTTLNIQHIESLNDVVYQITGVRVKETVPDRVLEAADEVEVVDLPPDDLLQRLKDGKVYVPPQAEQAIHRFFRKGNLLALRELALRYTARQVEDAMRSYMETHDILGPWPAGSRLMVCISASPLSEHLVRIGQRMAADLDAEFFAIHVESPQEVQLDESARDQLARNLWLAEELGAKVEVLSGQNIAEELIAFARAHNVTLIVAGLPRRKWWNRWLRDSVVNQLTLLSGPIHVLVIGNTGPDLQRPKVSMPKGGIDLRPILDGALSVAVTSGLCWLLQDWLGFVNIAMIMLLPVVLSSTMWGRRAGLTASLLAVGALDFLFVPPPYTFAVADLYYLPIFFVFFVVAIVTSFLAELARWQGESARRREKFVTSLYAFSRDLMAARNHVELLDFATKNIAEAFECDVKIFLPGKARELQVKAQTGERRPLDERELGVATWVFQHGLPAGQGTDTLSSATWSYLPLKTDEDVVGVLAVRLGKPGQTLLPEQKRLLEAFANVVALALARITPSFWKEDKRSFGMWWLK